MDAKLKSYVVLRAVRAIHGQRGRTSLIKVLKGSRSQGVDKMINTFDLLDLWGVFHKVPQEEIEGLLSMLMEKGFVDSQEVKFGAYSYPMLCLSQEGCDLLSVLEQTEQTKLQNVKDEVWASRRSLEISDRGQALEDFLGLLMRFLARWEDPSAAGLDFTELLDELDLEYTHREQLEKFIYRSTPDKQKERWRARYALDITCFFITKQLRMLLGALPELDTAIFRYCFQVIDGFQHSKEEILRYYSIPETDIQGVLKRNISRFSSKVWVDRFSFIRLVMSYIEDITPEQEGFPEGLVKETAAITYDLLCKGMSLPDIAKARDMSVNTIYTHFIKLIPMHQLDMDTIIPPDRLALIQSAISEAGTDSVRAIKEKLPGDILYGEIRLVMELQDGWKAA